MSNKQSSSYSKISFIGGDLRLSYMLREMAKRGYDVSAYCVPLADTFPSVTVLSSLQEALDYSDVIVGPVPFSKTQLTINSSIEAKDLEMKNFLSHIKASHIIFGGAITPCVKLYCDVRSIKYFDFMQNEEVAILNAIATAEGTIAEAIKRSPVNLSGSTCLVLGYGKCGSVLAAKLKGLDANVCVCARRVDALAQAKAAGFETLPFDSLKNSLHEFLFIFNTIPAQYFDESLLKEVLQDATLIDISSNPGCFDLDAASKLGIKTALCLGLPGKYAPKTSGLILTEALVAQLESL